MGEAIYQQVEDAIRRNLHVLISRPPENVMGGFYGRYPVGIEHGNIIMRDSDCGTVKPTMEWSPEKWRRHVSPEGIGLYRKVGMWDFVPADEPAADCIRFCHANPSTAGRELYRLRMAVRRMERGHA